MIFINTSPTVRKWVIETYKFMIDVNEYLQIEGERFAWLSVEVKIDCTAYPETYDYGSHEPSRKILDYKVNYGELKLPVYIEVEIEKDAIVAVDSLRGKAQWSLSD